MKLLKSLFIALTGILLVGCANPNTDGSESGNNGGSEPNPGGETGNVQTGTWSSQEQNLINTHLYGVEVPCFRIDGNGDLYYDTEYDCLSITGAEVTATELTAVTTLFENSGYTNVGDYIEVGYYTYVKTVAHEGTTKYVYANIYAVDTFYDEEWEMEYEDYSTSGTFFLDIYDPFCYEWPNDLVDYLLDSIGSTAVVPEYEADMYEVEDYIDSISYLGIYAYTEDTGAAEDYTAALEALNYDVVYDDSEGTYDAVDPTGTVSVYYYYEDGCLAIFVSEATNGGGSSGGGSTGNVGNEDVKAIADEYAYNLGFDEGAEYDTDNDMYWLAYVCEETITTLVAAVEDAITYAPEDLSIYEPTHEDTWVDGSEGAFALLSDETNSIFVEVGSYFDGNEIVVQISAYTA